MGQTLSICRKNGADWIQSVQTIPGGKALGDSATLLKVFCSGEVIGLDKGVMQSLPSLMPKCPSNLGVEFFCGCSVCLLTLFWLILGILLENYFSIHSNVQYWDIQTHPFFFMTRSFCQSRFIKDFTVYVLWHCLLTFLQMLWMYTVLIVVLQLAYYFLSIRLFINGVGICNMLKLNCPLNHKRLIQQ